MAAANVLIYGQDAAAKRLKCSKTYIKTLVDLELLPVHRRERLPTGGRPCCVYRLDALLSAHQERQRQISAIMRDVASKARATINARLADDFPGSESTAEAAHRKNVSDQTICGYVQNELLEPLCGGQGASGSYRFWPEDVDAAHARAQDNRQSSLTGKKLNTPRAAKKREAALTKRRNLPGLSSEAAAREVGVKQSSVVRAHRRGDLPALSERPLRFSQADVAKAFPPLLRKGEVTVNQIAGRIPRSGETTHRRVWKVINALGIKPEMRLAPNASGTYCRQSCVPEDRVREILDWLKREPDPPRSDELTKSQVRDEFHVCWYRLTKAINTYAPIAGRTRSIIGKNGRLVTMTVYPRAAIEAALRGEHWTPETEQPPASTALAAAQPAQRGTGAGEESASSTLRKLNGKKAGRKKTRQLARKVVRELYGKMTAREILAVYRERAGDRLRQPESDGGLPQLSVVAIRQIALQLRNSGELPGGGVQK